MSGGPTPTYPPPPDCSAINLRTVLGTPNLATISTLPVGAVLALEIEPGPPKRIVAKTHTGKLAGTITTRTQTLIACIEDGHQFEAEVLQVKGPQCDVEVRAR